MLVLATTLNIHIPPSPVGCADGKRGRGWLMMIVSRVCALWPCCSGISPRVSPTARAKFTREFLTIKSSTRANDERRTACHTGARSFFLHPLSMEANSSYRFFRICTTIGITCFLQPSPRPKATRLRLCGRRSCPIHVQYLLGSPREIPTHGVLQPTLLPPLSRTVAREKQAPNVLPPLPNGESEAYAEQVPGA